MNSHPPKTKHYPLRHEYETPQLIQPLCIGIFFTTASNCSTDGWWHLFFKNQRFYRINSEQKVRYAPCHATLPLGWRAIYLHGNPPFMDQCRGRGGVQSLAWYSGWLRRIPFGSSGIVPCGTMISLPWTMGVSEKQIRQIPIFLSTKSFFMDCVCPTVSLEQFHSSKSFQWIL
ncbi:hypothetical protein SAMN02746065_11874 [Desulfocicer vacuolatum DSM 3385]|uniref:Uncharacterized protein n=1 Tax=Desulfocicer vacuolatum DSM 3385 TaxID=1121400 RepID=A0A1W2DM31_9BACT|nr:hypothetical protein SAMN02746065_11874 [Desulfocicer vacuolatum DSM 3385]